MNSPSGMAPALGALARFLEREQGRGRDTVAVAPESIALLRGLPARIREAATAPREVREERATIDVPAPLIASGAVLAESALVSAATVLPSVKPSSAPAAGTPDEAARRQALNALFKQVKNAPEPRALGTLFDTVIFAVGNPMADIVFVGEAPGAEEEKQKKPFVGPAGQKLDQILKAMGLGRESVYISNLVKFRPKMGDGRFQGSRNRPPSQEEMASCLPFIRAEIDLLRPKVIVALGRTAAEGLLERGGAIAAFRNAVHDFSGIPVVVTYHPSYLLRQEAASEEEGRRAKRQVWEDMLRVMELAGLPVSERQRKYFL
jgi:uracil-DNA glycosylase family 4